MSDQTQPPDPRPDTGAIHGADPEDEACDIDGCDVCDDQETADEDLPLAEGGVA